MCRVKLFDKPLSLGVLDVDGVILDVKSCLKRDFIAVTEKFGLTPEPMHRYIDAVEADPTCWRADMAAVVQEVWPSIGAVRADAFAWSFQAERRRNPWPALAGSVEAIKTLHQHGFKLAICTTNDLPTLTNQLEAAGVDPLWFSAMSTWDYRYCKPDPRVLNPIFDAISVPREHAVYVGDWYPDMYAARGGNVRFVAVLSGGVSRESFRGVGVPDDHIVHNLEEFAALVEK